MCSTRSVISTAPGKGIQCGGECAVSGESHPQHHEIACSVRRECVISGESHLQLIVCSTRRVTSTRRVEENVQYKDGYIYSPMQGCAVWGKCTVSGGSLP